MKTIQYYTVYHNNDKSNLEYFADKEAAEKFINEQGFPDEYVIEINTLTLKDVDDHCTVNEYVVIFNVITNRAAHRFRDITIKKKKYPSVIVDKDNKYIRISSILSYDECDTLYNKEIKDLVEDYVKRLFVNLSLTIDDNNQKDN